jgi:hypothetical protein
MKTNTIFKSYLFYTLEEEKRYKEDIAEYMNEDSEEDEKVSTDDYSVFERLQEDIWFTYDEEKSNLYKELPNNIIAIGTVGRWDGTKQCFKELGNNLNEILFIGRDHNDINVYCDRYNVHSELVHHDGTDRVIYRMVKEGVDTDKLCEKQLYNGGLSKSDISRFTVSLTPFVKEVYGF